MHTHTIKILCIILWLPCHGFPALITSSYGWFRWSKHFVLTFEVDSHVWIFVYVYKRCLFLISSLLLGNVSIQFIALEPLNTCEKSSHQSFYTSYIKSKSQKHSSKTKTIIKCDFLAFNSRLDDSSIKFGDLFIQLFVLTLWGGAFKERESFSSLYSLQICISNRVEKNLHAQKAIRLLLATLVFTTLFCL